jgi:hypothetical protein
LNCSFRRLCIAFFFSSKGIRTSISIGWYLAKILLDSAAYSEGKNQFCKRAISDVVIFPSKDALVNVLSKSAITWKCSGHHAIIFLIFWSKSSRLEIIMLDILISKINLYRQKYDRYYSHSCTYNLQGSKGFLE